MTQNTSESESQAAPGTPAPPPSPGDVPPLKETNKDAQTWAVVCHLAALGVFVFPFAGNVIGPLVVWLIKGKDHPYVGEQGKEAINFQITMLIAGALSFFLMFLIIGFFLLPTVVILDLVFVIIAAVKTREGDHYRYPLSIRFLK